MFVTFLFAIRMIGCYMMSSLCLFRAATGVFFVWSHADFPRGLCPFGVADIAVVGRCKGLAALVAWRAMLSIREGEALCEIAAIDGKFRSGLA